MAHGRYAVTGAAELRSWRGPRLANKNAVIDTNEGNFDLRQTVNEPRVFGMRLSYRFGRAPAGTSSQD